MSRLSTRTFSRISSSVRNLDPEFDLGLIAMALSLFFSLLLWSFSSTESRDKLPLPIWKTSTLNQRKGRVDLNFHVMSSWLQSVQQGWGRGSTSRQCSGGGASFPSWRHVHDPDKCTLDQRKDRAPHPLPHDHITRSCDNIRSGRGVQRVGWGSTTTTTST